ncbi:YoaK family protein [Streptomyces sp. NPDC007088]|uniref:YoaK family protein n=1 Tax=Streptomyces sp. NPDC007088 TaxID=3364773 RepID=UPI0036A0DA52
MATSTVGRATERLSALGGRGALLALSFASGAVDALAVVALGGAFAGVMTGNLVFLGAAAAGRAPEGAWAPGAALCGYVLGSALVAPLLHPVGARSAERGAWPGRVLAVLAAEALLLAAVAAGWAWSGTDAGPPTRYVLLGLLATAMGAQASAVLALGPTGAPTTFFTSTLTTLVLGVSAGRATAANGWAAARLLCLVAGACCAVLLRRALPPWAPALPAVLVAVVAVSGALAARRARTAD